MDGKAESSAHGHGSLALLHHGPQEGRVRRLLLEQVAAQAVGEDNAHPLGRRQVQPVLKAGDPEACRRAGEDFGDGALAEGGGGGQRRCSRGTFGDGYD